MEEPIPEEPGGCVWCAEPNETKEYLRQYSSLPPPSWFNSADENIKNCIDCVRVYHEGRAAVVADDRDFEQILFPLELKRLLDSFNDLIDERSESLNDDHDNIISNDDDEDETFWNDSQNDAFPLPIPVQEILWFPFYLQDEDIDKLFCNLMKVLQRVEQLQVAGVNQPHSGMFLLLIHPNRLISNWAKQCLTCLCNSGVQSEEFAHVIGLMLSVFTFCLFNKDNTVFSEDAPTARFFLSSHLFPDQQLAYWQGLCCLLQWISKESLNHLGSELHNDMTMMYYSTLQTNDDRDSFWPKLEAFYQIIDKLGFRIWQYLPCTAEEVFNSIFDHPCTRQAINHIKEDYTRFKHHLTKQVDESTPYTWIRAFMSTLLESDAITEDFVTMVLEKMVTEVNEVLMNHTNSSQTCLFLDHSISSLIKILEDLLTVNCRGLSVRYFMKCLNVMTQFLTEFPQDMGCSRQAKNWQRSPLRYMKNFLMICVKMKNSSVSNNDSIQSGETILRDIDLSVLDACLQLHLHIIGVETVDEWERENTSEYHVDCGSSTSAATEYDDDYGPSTSAATEHNEDYRAGTSAENDDDSCDHTFKPFVTIKKEIPDDYPEPSPDLMFENSSIRNTLEEEVDDYILISSDSEDDLPDVPWLVADTVTVKSEPVSFDEVSDEEWLVRFNCTRNVHVRVKRMSSDDIEQMRQLYTEQDTGACLDQDIPQDTDDYAVIQDTKQDNEEDALCIEPTTDSLQHAMPPSEQYTAEDSDEDTQSYGDTEQDEDEDMTPNIAELPTRAYGDTVQDEDMTANFVELATQSYGDTEQDDNEDMTPNIAELPTQAYGDTVQDEDMTANIVELPTLSYGDTEQDEDEDMTPNIAELPTCAYGDTEQDDNEDMRPNIVELATRAYSDTEQDEDMTPDIAELATKKHSGNSTLCTEQRTTTQHDIVDRDAGPSEYDTVHDAPHTDEGTVTNLLASVQPDSIQTSQHDLPYASPDIISIDDAFDGTVYTYTPEKIHYIKSSSVEKIKNLKRKLDDKKAKKRIKLIDSEIEIIDVTFRHDVKREFERTNEVKPSTSKSSSCDERAETSASSHVFVPSMTSSASDENSESSEFVKSDSDSDVKFRTVSKSSKANSVPNTLIQRRTIKDVCVMTDSDLSSSDCLSSSDIEAGLNLPKRNEGAVSKRSNSIIEKTTHEDEDSSRNIFAELVQKRQSMEITTPTTKPLTSVDPSPSGTSCDDGTETIVISDSESEFQTEDVGRHHQKVSFGSDYLKQLFSSNIKIGTLPEGLNKTMVKSICSVNDKPATSKALATSSSSIEKRLTVQLEPESKSLSIPERVEGVDKPHHQIPSKAHSLQQLGHKCIGSRIAADAERLKVTILKSNKTSQPKKGKGFLQVANRHVSSTAAVATGLQERLKAAIATGLKERAAATACQEGSTAAAATGLQEGSTAAAAACQEGSTGLGVRSTSAAAATGLQERLAAAIATGLKERAAAAACQEGSTAAAAIGLQEGSAAAACQEGSTAAAATGLQDGSTAAAATGLQEGSKAAAATGLQEGSTAAACQEGSTAAVATGLQEGSTAAAAACQEGSTGLGVRSTSAAAATGLQEKSIAAISTNHQGRSTAAVATDHRGRPTAAAATEGRQSSTAAGGRPSGDVALKHHPRPSGVIVKLKPSHNVSSDQLVAMTLLWNPEWLDAPKVSHQEILKQLVRMMNLKPVQDTSMPLVRMMNLKPVQDTFTSIDDYVRVFAPLLLLETWHAVVSGYQKNKLSNGNTLTIKCINYTGCLLTCEQFVPIASKRVYPAVRDLVILSPPEEAPTLNYRVFGLITNRSRRVVKNQPLFVLTYTLKVIIVDLSDFLASNSKIQIQVVASMTSHHRLFMSFRDLHKQVLARDILYPRVWPEIQIAAGHDTGRLIKLNNYQLEAAGKIFTCMEMPFKIPRISLLHGPPGTGKTRTIIHIIQRILKEKREVDDGPLLPGQKRNIDNRPRILVCAPSNTAVDRLVLNVIEMCLQDHRDGKLSHDCRFNCGSYNIVRLGRDVQIKCKRYQLSSIVEKQVEKKKKTANIMEVERNKKELDDCETDLKKVELYCVKLRMNRQEKSVEFTQAERDRDNLQRRLKNLKKKTEETNIRVNAVDMRNKIVKQADVVFCTLNGSGCADLEFLANKTHEHFKCVIVDEACQCTELDTLIPLKFKASKLLLVGDPHQLPATVLSEEAKRMGFHRSLFERMYKYYKKCKKSPVHMLRTQYRMHPEICKFPSRHFYNNQLETYGSIQERYKSFPFRPYLVFDIIKGREESTDGNIQNKDECRMVEALVLQLVRLEKVRIGIITPYRRQMTLLQESVKTLARTNASIEAKIEISTVDGFQGQEKDIIILSCVRARGRGNSIGFVADRNRMNVALTRAKMALYLVGNLATLETNQDWNALIKDADRRNVIHQVHHDYKRAAEMCKKLSRIGNEKENREPKRLMNREAKPDESSNGETNSLTRCPNLDILEEGEIRDGLRSSTSGSTRRNGDSVPSTSSVAKINTGPADRLEMTTQEIRSRHPSGPLIKTIEGLQPNPTGRRRSNKPSAGGNRNQVPSRSQERVLDQGAGEQSRSGTQEVESVQRSRGQKRSGTQEAASNKRQNRRETAKEDSRRRVNGGSRVEDGSSHTKSKPVAKRRRHYSVEPDRHPRPDDHASNGNRLQNTPRRTSTSTVLTSRPTTCSAAATPRPTTTSVIATSRPTTTPAVGTPRLQPLGHGRRIAHTPRDPSSRGTSTSERNEMFQENFMEQCNEASATAAEVETSRRRSTGNSVNNGNSHGGEAVSSDRNSGRSILISPSRSTRKRSARHISFATEPEVHEFQNDQT